MEGQHRPLEVRLDRSWLDDSARQYPVTEDPEIHNAGFGATPTSRQGSTGTTPSTPGSKVGTYDGGAHIGRPAEPELIPQLGVPLEVSARAHGGRVRSGVPRHPALIWAGGSRPDKQPNWP